MISKTTRQIALFHIFLCREVVQYEEITDLMQVSQKTIMRDIRELECAGLINVRFSRKLKGYVHRNDRCRSPFLTPHFSDNKLKNMHIEKLIRLATIMINLSNHRELPYWDLDYSKSQETCSSWYKKNFPNVSVRTMQRDFAELNKIGYEIEYKQDDKYYIVDFPYETDRVEAKIKNALR